MATPEQNTLLAMQLFRQPADDYARNSEQRLRVLTAIAQAEREERLRRDLATQQAQREDARWTARGNREDARAKASDDHKAKTIAEAERRQKESNTAKDKADIENEFDRLYPQYAAAAARAGKPITPRESYQSTRAGLGQLAADFQTVQAETVNSQQADAAEALWSERQLKVSEVQAAKDALAKLSKPSPEDEKFARNTAVKALEQELRSGGIESAKSLRPDAIQKGIAALAAGERTIAQSLLGGDAMRAYEAAYDQTLFQLPNVKARAQEKSQVQQQLLAVQREASRVDSDLRRAAGTNRFLAQKFKEDTSGLQQLFAPEVAAPMSFESVTPARAAETAPAAAAPAPAAAAPAVNPNLFDLMGGRGGIMPARQSAPAPAAPRPAPMINIDAAPRGPAPIIQIPNEAPRAPAPIIQVPGAAPAAPYPAMRSTVGSSAVDRLITAPVDATFGNYNSIYPDGIPAPAQSRMLGDLTQLIHSSEYGTPEERAVARNRIYQLLGR